MHLPLLQDILILLGFSVIIVFILQRLKLPSILGFLITGVIIGPYGLSLVKAVEQVEVISEIGVILLLFVIGMELSIKQLAAIKKTVFIGGLLQVSLTAIVAGLVYFSFDFPWNESVFVGFLFSLSSTAIVLKVFQDRNEITAPHARNALGILIFQDIIVVPMMLVTPIIAGQSESVMDSVLSLLVKSAIVIVITVVSARYIVPKLMYVVAKTRSNELFLITTITICFAVTFLTSEAGLSLALGAFLAGLIISESEYSHQATSIILPFRELFTSFFFISVGMLLNIDFFLENAGMIMLIVLALFIVKGGIASLAVAVLRYPPRTVFLTGLSLFQVGEFAFILSKVGIEYGLLDKETNQFFLAISIISMLITPFVIIFSDQITGWFLNSSVGKIFQKKSKSNNVKEKEEAEVLENHLVIIGYGINGSNLAKAAQFSNIPFVAIELNAATVRKEREKGIPIIFGDATQEHILDSVHLYKARAAVVAISDPKATKTVITNIRSISQSVYLLVRTRYVKEMDELKALGADEVIPEEFETSVEIFSRILHNFLIPTNDIEEFIDSLRADNYDLLQENKKLPKTIRPTKIPDFKVTCMRINRDSGKFIGKSLQEADIRNNYGVNIIAISRDGKMNQSIHSSDKLLQNDLIYVQGDSEKVEDFHRLLN